MGGATQTGTAYAVHLLSAIQHGMLMCGDVGEIGSFGGAAKSYLHPLDKLSSRPVQESQTKQATFPSRSSFRQPLQNVSSSSCPPTLLHYPRTSFLR